MRAIGLMSGTSMDGVDVALIDTDGEGRISFGPQASFAYEEADRVLLRGALDDAAAMHDRAARPGRLGAAEAMITARHASAVEQFLAAHDVSRQSIDLIGFHGQTVLHRPDAHLTVQIGDGAALARRLGIKVASDFRAADVAAGGQGAPLVPVYHRALVARDGLEGPVVVINIGGVANLTYVAEDADPIACDTGPGNALLDDLMLARTGVPFDRDGATAATGQVDAAALHRLLDHPYFDLPAPKSLDRNAFSRAPVDHLSTEDAAATLVAFTAETIARATRQTPGVPRLAVVCGGGGRNLVLMRELAARLACPLESADALGWSVEAMEAQAFAYLAVRQARALPITFPGTTGVAKPLPGGRMSLP
jgi:anhydro-N-acetylmuramic acid kinase